MWEQSAWIEVKSSTCGRHEQGDLWERWAVVTQLACEESVLV